MARRKKRAQARVYFQDEAPKIGCGWRFINILSIGSKWVRFEEHATGRRARMSRKAWELHLRTRINRGVVI